MNKTNTSIVVILSVLILSGLCKCEKQLFQGPYNDIYGTWVLKDISGGFSGRGFERDFNILEISRRNVYSVFKNDTLISEGKIIIYEQNKDELKIEFSDKSGYSSLAGGIKSVKIEQDTLFIHDVGADGYSWFFVRCEVYNDNNFYQPNRTLAYINVIKYNIGFGKRYTSIFFVNEDLGFLTCYDGSILKTPDGGRTWHEVFPVTDIPLYDLNFPSEMEGFAVGGKASCGGNDCIPPGSLLLKTINGGESWTKQDILSNSGEFHLIQFIDNNTGLVIGLGNNLITNNGGSDWEEYSPIFKEFIYDMYFVNHKTGFVSGIKGILFKTTDGGQSWTDLSLDVSYQIYSVGFINENEGYLGSYKKLMKSLEGGRTWNFMDFAPTGVNSIGFTDNGELVVFGGRDYYSGSCSDVWNSRFNIFINGRWFGDERIQSCIKPFRLNPGQYYSVSLQDELIITKIIR